MNDVIIEAIHKTGGNFMKIAVIGGGAMGSLYGGLLSQNNDVVIVVVNRDQTEKVNCEGLLIHEADGSQRLCHPKMIVCTDALEPVDLVILFVKSMVSRAALEQNRALIGPDTYVMTLQNGSGHETILSEFTDAEHVVIGTTQHNSAVLELGEIRHAGSGITNIGCISGDVHRLEPIAEAFRKSGFETRCCPNVKELIWSKMFTNVSVSALTGVLEVPMGYIVENPYAWTLCETLIREAVAVAEGEGLHFDADEKIAEVRAVCERNPSGITSICADIRNGRKTEVDTISGSVVAASHRNGISAPTHELIVTLIHALEDRKNA